MVTLLLQALPPLLSYLSKLEGWGSKSVIERKTMGKYYFLLIVNVFFYALISGTVIQQLRTFLQNPTSYVEG